MGKNAGPRRGPQAGRAARPETRFAPAGSTGGPCRTGPGAPAGAPKRRRKSFENPGPAAARRPPAGGANAPARWPRVAAVMTAGELEVPRRRREEIAAGRGWKPQPEPTGGPRYGATGVAAARRDRSRGRPGADQVRRQSLQEALVSGATEVGGERFPGTEPGTSVTENVSCLRPEPAARPRQGARRTRPKDPRPRRHEA